MKVMSYNIRNDYKMINDNIVRNKSIDICSLIKNHDIDIIGMQELSQRQLGLYKKQLSDYIFIGNHRHSGYLSNEYCGIFVKKSIKIKSYKTYSLSHDINRLGAKLEDHNYPRICSLCHFKYDNNNYLLINTHLDNSFIDEKKEELNILIDIIKKEIKNESIILMGDFNTSDTYLKPLIKELKLKNVTSHLGNTFISSDKQIDHILISKELKTDYKEKLLVEYSDHYPLVISVQ